jgi:amino acid adenylation domain-containing protein
MSDSRGANVEIRRFSPPPLPIPAAEAVLARKRRLERSVEFDTSLTVVGHVTRNAVANPAAIAVTQGQDRATYRQLLATVLHVRGLLLGSGRGAGELIAVLGSRSGDTVAIYLAIESISAIYLPIEPEWPDQRVTDVLLRSRTRVVVTVAREETARLERLPLEVLIINVGRTLFENMADVPSAGGELPTRAAGDQVRYVIYTSGSTGQPKGAMVEHQGVMNHLWSKVNELSLVATDVVAFTASIGFDISIWQMLAPLLVGGAVAVVEHGDTRFPRRLYDTLLQLRATVVELVPSMLRWYVREVAKRHAHENGSHVRWLISTGEELYPDVARKVLDLLPQVRLLNAYGPTECSDDVTHHVVDRGDLRQSRIPVGVPLPNVVLYLLISAGETWRAAEVGEPCELFVGGAQVGSGYLNDLEASLAAFYQDVLDPDSPSGRIYRTGDSVLVDDTGRVCFLGRLDRQVKISGVRVELDEIEHALRRHPAVSQCAVITLPNASGREEFDIVAYLTLSREGVEKEIFAQYLGESLPPSMIPRLWRVVSSLPLTDNGKIDYFALNQSVTGESKENRAADAR